MNGEGGGEDRYRIPEEILRRIAFREPAWSSRLAQARSGNLTTDAGDGTRRAVTEAEVVEAAVGRVEPREMRLRAKVLEAVTVRGLSHQEAHDIWLRWLNEWMTGGPTPTDALAAELKSPDIRSHAALWRARLRKQDA